MAPKVKLTYFNIRGRGEVARLILKYAKVDFEDFRLGNGQWAKIKPTIITGKVPMLEYDGHTIVESYAINRFLAREYGLAGKDKFEQALVDGITDVAKDFFAAVVPWLYSKKEGNEEELKKAHLHDPVEQYLPIFEKFLNESKSGFLAPSGLTWADFVVTEVLISISNQDSKALDKYAAAKDLIKKVKNVSELKDYYASRKE